MFEERNDTEEPVTLMASRLPPLYRAREILRRVVNALRPREHEEALDDDEYEELPYTQEKWAERGHPVHR